MKRNLLFQINKNNKIQYIFKNIKIKIFTYLFKLKKKSYY